MREVSRTEAVVDVHHSDPLRARVQHREQRRQSLEARAVPDARWDSHHRAVYQPANDARKRALHAGAHDDDVRGIQYPLLVEQAVEARDAYVIYPLDAAARRDRRTR